METATKLLAGWKPTVGDRYWWNTHAGGTASSEWIGDKIDYGRQEDGNCWPNEAEARKARQRQIGAKHRGFLPKVDQYYWMFSMNVLGGGLAIRVPWFGLSPDLVAYQIGNVSRTEAEALAWGEENAAAYMLPENKQ